MARLREGISFTHQSLPGRVVFGADSVVRVAEEVDALDASRVLLIASGSAAGPAGPASPVARIEAALGDRIAGRVSEVVPHVPESAATAARQRAAGIGADVVVCVGGGSATGLAKVVAVAMGIPIVAIPTTYAGSEVTPAYGITGERSGKVVRRDLRALPRVVLYDPALTTSLPPHVTATSGLNAVAHCVAALRGGDPYSDLYATEGLARLIHALPRAVESPGDLDARAGAMLGAHFAGRALAGTGSSVHHRLCHTIGGTFGLVHAEVHAALLPYTIDPAARDRVAAALGAPDAATGLYDLAAALGVPAGLAAIGLPPEAIDAIEEHRTLLAAAYDGRRPTVQNGVEHVGRDEV